MEVVAVSTLLQYSKSWRFTACSVSCLGLFLSLQFELSQSEIYRQGSESEEVSFLQVCDDNYARLQFHCLFLYVLKVL